ncbi:IS21 family transposase [Actinotalea sp. K2]|uniref:IS21 family transposase n=1 Tax=Actinotalea sp. K2 TaxID=2939438 RepID=UPI0020175E05|nr:IS21 family transposase [Actinotalea sp. K2]MCL3863041.1 IS21 family transposase [Actinotalea sp. K2]
MMSVEDWAEIRRLHRVEGMAIKAIARRLGVSRNAVRRALARDAPPKYVRAPKGSIVAAVEPAVRELLRTTPDMPATVIAERIGWDRSITVLRDRVRELRPYYLPVDPATRTAYDPGQRVQCDLWFPPAPVPVGFGHTDSPPVLVMVSGYSRMIFARMVPTRQAEDLIAGHWALLQVMGAVPKELVWDNEPAVGSWRAGKPKLADQFEAFRGTLGISVHQCRPRDPEAKGLVERVNGYFETSFLPGRTFAGPGDFNTQISDWLVRANARHHRSLGCAPATRWAADNAAMLVLPPLAPQIGWSTQVRLPRDHYVRLDSNDYSVDPVAVGRKVTVTADLEQVSVRMGTKVVAAHQRCWARQQTITDPAHRAAALAMSFAAAHRAPAPPVEEVEQRDLADYDAVFGLAEVMV